MFSSVFKRILVIAFLFSPIVSKSDSPADSLINYTVQKLNELHQQNLLHQKSGEFNLMKFNLVVDDGDYDIVFSNMGFHYLRGQNQSTFPIGTVSNGDFDDLLNDYNLEINPDSGVFLYSIILVNYPMIANNEKLKNFTPDPNKPLFAQLKSAGIVKMDWYLQSRKEAADIISKCVLKAQQKGVFKNAIFAFTFSTAALTNTHGMGHSFLYQAIVPAGEKAAGYFSLVQSSATSAVHSCNAVNGITNKQYQLLQSFLPAVKCAFKHYCALDVSNYNEAAKNFYLANDNSTFGLDERMYFINATNLLQSLDNETAAACIQEMERIVSNENGSYAVYYRNRPKGSMYANEGFIKNYIHALYRLENKSSSLSRDSILFYGYITCNFLPYKKFTTDTRINLLKKLLESSCTDQINVLTVDMPSQYCEKMALNVFGNVSESEQKHFLEKIRLEGALKSLVNQIDNSTLGGFGNDNYTKLIHYIFAYCQNAFGNVLKEGKEINTVHIMKFSERFFASNDHILSDGPYNNILITPYNGNLLNNVPDFSQSVGFTAYDWVGICFEENSTFTNLPKGTTLWAPAIYVQWLYNQKMWADITVATTTTLDVVSITSGVGGIFSAGSKAAKIWSAIEATVGLVDLTLKNDDVRVKVKNTLGTYWGDLFLKVWDKFSLLVNASSLYKGVIQLPEDAGIYRKIFKNNKDDLRLALAESDYHNLEILDAELAKHVDEMGEVVGEIGKLTATQIEEYVAMSTKQHEKTKVMFGKFENGGPTSYIARAGSEHTYFDMGDKWEEVYNLVQQNDEEIWKINKKFIDNQRGLNKAFYLSHDPNVASGFYQREIEYITTPIEQGGLGGNILNLETNLWKIEW